MPVVWRTSGESVGTIDLRKLDGDQIVVHFGGALTSVDAYTFANSLVAFADTVRAVNNVINPGQNIEIRLEAVGPGSFRAVVRRVAKGFGGFFSEAGKAILFGVVGTLIYQNWLAPDDSVNVVINTDEVIIERGGDRIIVTREVYEQARTAMASPEVVKGLGRTFEAVEKDDAIDNFGLTQSLTDETPLIQIPRQDFARLADAPRIVAPTETRRLWTERARLLITKAWLTPGQHKWSFEWNGVPISARVKDQNFWTKVESREYLIGSGDALDADIEFYQDYDASTEVWANDGNSYLVTKVHRIISRDGGQLALV